MSIFRTLSAAIFVSGAILAQDAMFRGNLRHTGVYDSQGSTLKTVKWKFKTAGMVLSSPVIYKDAVLFGSTDRNLYSVALSDGSLKWKFNAKANVNSSPAIANDTVYFGDFNGIFHALDAATGKEKWSFTAAEHRFTAPGMHGMQPVTEVMPDPFDCYLSSPAVVAGVVYFGSGDGNMYALDAAGGALKWKFQTGDVVHASPAVDNGVVYFGSWDSYFYAVDAQSGKLVWKHKTGEDPKYHNQVGFQSSAAIANGLVYVGCRDSNLYAFDAKTGDEKWKFNNKGSWVIGSPAVHEGKVYFATSDSSLFHAVDAKTGAPLFELNTKTYTFSSPAIAGGLAFVGTHGGILFAIDLAKKQFAAEFRTEASKENGPKYLTAEGKIDPYKLFTGMTFDETEVGLFKMYTMGSILSSPALHDGVVYVGSNDGYLYAIA